MNPERTWTWEEERDAHNENWKRANRISIRAVNLVPAQLAELGKPAKPRRRVQVLSQVQRLAIDRSLGVESYWRSDTLSEAWESFCWRHRWARVLNDLAIVVLVAGVVVFVVWASFTPTGPVVRP